MYARELPEPALRTDSANRSSWIADRLMLRVRCALSLSDASRTRTLEVTEPDIPEPDGMPVILE